MKKTPDSTGRNYIHQKQTEKSRRSTPLENKAKRQFCTEPDKIRVDRLKHLSKELHSTGKTSTDV